MNTLAANTLKAGRGQQRQHSEGNMHIIRTYSAGVHVGAIKSMSADGRLVTLENASRIWRWKGANTLNELALHGPDQEYTRISERVPSIVLTEAIEHIPVADAALGKFEPRWPR